ncbi:MAG: tyrosine-type recombinase/integrase [Syntrophales bacterium]|nr:tyrosine-type recombinase/integrase [Syntrophales bacterium]
MELKKNVIENAELPVKGQSFLWDDELKGFGVRLTPTARTYIVQARVKGVTRRVTLGKHGVLALQEARKRALRELSKMSEGIDPIKEKKRAKAQSVTLEQVVEAYLKDRRNLKESSRADIFKHLDKSFSDWAKKPIISITRDKATKRFRELSDRSPAQANQGFRNLRALFNYAMGAYRDGDKPLIPENPVKAISDLKMWNHIKPRSGRIPTDKIGAAWNILQELRTAPTQTTVGRTLADAVTFLMLTGARWSEMAELTWNQVNLDEEYWTLPDPKNRTSITFPLSVAAIDMLKDRPSTKEFIFPARSKTGHITEVRSVLKKVSDATGNHVSAHDLRRTFRAIAGECGVDFWKTKLLMGHKISGDVTIQHYTETNDLRYLAKDIQAVSDWIVRQGAIAASDNVVQIPIKAKGNKR